MFQRPSLPRRIPRRRPVRLELMELDRRDQPVRLGLSLPALSLDVLPAAMHPVSIKTESATISISTVSTQGDRASILTEKISVTEIVNSMFTELIITVTPSASSTEPTTPSAPSRGTEKSEPTRSAPETTASATAVAAVPAQESTSTAVSTGVRGVAIAPAATTPFVIVSDSPATVRGGGPTSETVAPRTIGPTTVVLGPPTATILSAGGLGGVAVVDDPAVTNTPAPATGAGPTGTDASSLAAPPATVRTEKRTGGGDTERGEEARPVVALPVGETWLERYGTRAALAALGAAAGGYGVIRWRRSRALRNA